eukprot:scaffold387_cov136-Skeletonema_menzelii.AAC.1
MSSESDSDSDDSSEGILSVDMSASSSDEDDGDCDWDEKLKRIKRNDPILNSLSSDGEHIHIFHMTDEKCEELGRDIANNTHLTKVYLAFIRTLNDQKMSSLFRGLSRSSSIEHLELESNVFGAAGVRSMVPFLQNANSLTRLDLSYNNILTDGFNLIFRALRDSPIETLDCRRCGIESIDIDSEHIPRNLKSLFLLENSINADGCRGLVKLLQGGDSTLEALYLNNNQIDDEGVGILVNSLQNDSSLTQLDLVGNSGISFQGEMMLLKLVNDISSIEATLRSNHTLTYLHGLDEQIQMHINDATWVNKQHNPGAAGREKLIWTQLNSARRAELAEIQGVNHSLYSEIDPLHLPEVLALVGPRHGQRELYVALKSSIAGVISTVNEEQCIRQKMAYHAAKLEELGTRLAEIEAAE